MAANGAGSCFFPTNPDLADILGDTDFDFENFYFLFFFGSQISRFPGPRFPNFQKSGLGPAWAHLGPSGGLDFFPDFVSHVGSSPDIEGSLAFGPPSWAQAWPRPDFWKFGNLEPRNLGIWDPKK